MKQRILLASIVISSAALVPMVSALSGSSPDVGSSPDADTVCYASDSLMIDSAALAARYLRLTEEDYAAVAAKLGINTAAIKAVVDIETGQRHEGFTADCKPIINFDLSMFKRFASRRGIKLGQYRKSHAVVFSSPNVARYGSRQSAQYARLDAAMTIDSVAAIEGTFWGMFQIGGFNWKLCGCESIGQFVERMSHSEREQLELFAAFVKSRGLDKYLRAHNWSGFSLRYNGPGYKRMGYDVKMAAAYRRYLND